MLHKLKNVLLVLAGLVWLALVPLTAQAADPDELLPPEQAFAAQVQRQDKQLIVTLTIADGYYVYRDRIQASSTPADLVGKPVLPEGHVKNDPYFGEQVIYTGTTRIAVPLTDPAAGKFVLNFRLQGCAKAGVCYPPYTHALAVAAATASKPAEGKSVPKSLPATVPAKVSTDNTPASAPLATTREASQWINAAAPASSPATTAATPTPAAGSAIGIDRKHIATTLLTFLLAGIGMAFTACMYPLLPIVSSLIAGQGQTITRTRGFLLTFSYVQGMALTYTLVGVLTGMTGSLLTVWLQQPAVILAGCAVIVFFALSMFDLYAIQLPSSLQSRLAESSNRLSGGRVTTVFAMGVLSALLVGPCVAPPLGVALGFISQTGDALLGGAALYAMAMGLGLPLLIIGTFGGHLLPRAGGWMKIIKSVFGVVMLGVAIWLASPFLPAFLPMLLWAALAIGSAVFLHATEPLPVNAGAIKRLGKALGILLLLVGMAQLAGVLSGARNPLRPLEALGSVRQTSGDAVSFAPIHSVQDLDRAIAAANGKPVMLDFYADWCVSCKEMEETTFKDAGVVNAMRGYVLLRADVTDSTAEHTALLKRFGLFGPPGIIVFDKSGKEAQRVIGYTESAPFLALIKPFV